MFKRLKHCHNTNDFRALAQQRLPSPVFHYIDGAPDDEVTYKRNTEAYILHAGVYSAIWSFFSNS